MNNSCLLTGSASRRKRFPDILPATEEFFGNGKAALEKRKIFFRNLPRAKFAPCNGSK
jgi:hypothetical protein